MAPTEAFLVRGTGWLAGSVRPSVGFVCQSPIALTSHLCGAVRFCVKAAVIPVALSRWLLAAFLPVSTGPPYTGFVKIDTPTGADADEQKGAENQKFAWTFLDFFDGTSVTFISDVSNCKLAHQYFLL